MGAPSVGLPPTTAVFAASGGGPAQKTDGGGPVQQSPQQLPTQVAGITGGGGTAPAGVNDAQLAAVLTQLVSVLTSLISALQAAQAVQGGGGVGQLPTQVPTQVPTQAPVAGGGPAAGTAATTLQPYTGTGPTLEVGNNIGHDPTAAVRGATFWTGTAAAGGVDFALLQADWSDGKSLTFSSGSTNGLRDLPASGSATLSTGAALSWRTVVAEQSGSHNNYGIEYTVTRPGSAPLVISGAADTNPTDDTKYASPLTAAETTELIQRLNSMSTPQV